MSTETNTNDQEIEEWKDIPGYEKLYRASNLGRIWSCLSQRYIKPRLNNRGYLRVNLFKNGKRQEFKLHRAVLLSFDPTGQTRSKTDVAHKNDIKEDCKLINLEWQTHKKNVTYANKKRVKTTIVDGPF